MKPGAMRTRTWIVGFVTVIVLTQLLPACDLRASFRHQNAGEFTVTGHVWVDMDGDGVQDPGEPPVALKQVSAGQVIDLDPLNEFDSCDMGRSPESGTWDLLMKDNKGLYEYAANLGQPGGTCVDAAILFWVDCPAGTRLDTDGGNATDIARGVYTAYYQGLREPDYIYMATQYVDTDVTIDFACIPTATTAAPTAWVETMREVNCRRGSSTAFPVATVLPPEEEYAIQGVNPDGSWLLIIVPDTGQCWVRADVVQPQGDLTGMPVYQNAPTPTPGAAAEPVATAGAEEPPAIPEYCMCLGNCNPCATVCGGVGPACTP